MNIKYLNNINGLLGSLKYDFPAGIAVFLIAIPLSLGIALASGAPLFAGLIAGILSGIVIAPISGSALGISGPTAALALVACNQHVHVILYQA